MPARSDDPLRRVTLNLYEADISEMERIHGQGWTVVVREMVHAHIQAYRALQDQDRPRTLGDLQ